MQVDSELSVSQRLNNLNNQRLLFALWFTTNALFFPPLIIYLQKPERKVLPSFLAGESSSQGNLQHLGDQNIQQRWELSLAETNYHIPH
jgi:hypothetical protein